MTALTTGPHMPDATPSNVIPFRRHGDFATLARTEIAAVRKALNLGAGEFAVLLGEHLTWEPTAAAVRGWEATAVPPGDVVLAAQYLARITAGVDVPSYVGGDPDVVHAYAARRDLARPEWQDIIRGRVEHIWLAGLAEQGYANDGGVPGILERAAGEGCDIRVLLLDPDYPLISGIDTDEGNPPGTLAARIRGSLHRFQRMTARCAGRMQVRTSATPPTISIVRGDDQMLITPYARFLTGGDSPTLLLEATPDGQIFTQYEQHFNLVWNDSKESAAA